MKKFLKSLSLLSAVIAMLVSPFAFADVVSKFIILPVDHSPLAPHATLSVSLDRLPHGVKSRVICTINSTNYAFIKLLFTPQIHNGILGGSGFDAIPSLNNCRMPNNQGTIYYGENRFSYAVQSDAAGNSFEFTNVDDYFSISFTSCIAELPL